MFRLALKCLLEQKILSKHKMEAGASPMSTSDIDLISKQRRKNHEEHSLIVDRFFIDYSAKLNRCQVIQVESMSSF